MLHVKCVTQTNIAHATVMSKLYMHTREDEGKRGNPPYRPYSHRNPSEVIFRSPARSSAPRGLGDSQSSILNFTHVDS